MPLYAECDACGNRKHVEEGADCLDFDKNCSRCGQDGCEDCLTTHPTEGLICDQCERELRRWAEEDANQITD